MALIFTAYYCSCNTSYCYCYWRRLNSPFIVIFSH